MGRRKRKNAINQPLCSVCQVFHVPTSSSIPRCSSCSIVSRNTICDSCYHKHIFTTISKDITAAVICPEFECQNELTKAIIQPILYAYGHQALWEDYIVKSTWQGTSVQWIKRFSVGCPSCRVPIEKNGGCDHMRCTRCSLSFGWQAAKVSSLVRAPFWWRAGKARIATILYRCFIVVFVLLFAKFLLFWTEKFI